MVRWRRAKSASRDAGMGRENKGDCSAPRMTGYYCVLEREEDNDDDTGEAWVGGRAVRPGRMRILLCAEALNQTTQAASAIQSADAWWWARRTIRTTIGNPAEFAKPAGFSQALFGTRMREVPSGRRNRTPQGEAHQNNAHDTARRRTRRIRLAAGMQSLGRCLSAVCMC